MVWIEFTPHPTTNVPIREESWAVDGAGYKDQNPKVSRFGYGGWIKCFGRGVSFYTESRPHRHGGTVHQPEPLGQVSDNFVCYESLRHLDMSSWPPTTHHPSFGAKKEVKRRNLKNVESRYKSFPFKNRERFGIFYWLDFVYEKRCTFGFSKPHTKALTHHLRGIKNTSAHSKKQLRSKASSKQSRGIVQPHYLETEFNHT
ncbi:hypothetical protein AVEN_141219-1 [Araneus ventricosus]|uniref:Uncharacterized protein n=1 Tax=Araneus ventricosus TaxID=182803 RepID=A0A4Y1ZWG8_ARAVE|nr:hypothetical protein AVEN_141219-1 [Araneus ventricosus]